MDDYGYDLDGEEAEVEQSSSILALLADVEVCWKMHPWMAMRLSTGKQENVYLFENNVR